MTVSTSLLYADIALDNRYNNLFSVTLYADTILSLLYVTLLRRTKILRNTAAVDRSSAAIMRTEGLAAETEDIGNEITVELGNFTSCSWQSYFKVSGNDKPSLCPLCLSSKSFFMAYLLLTLSNYTLLGQQREQLYRTRGMLDETDNALDKSRVSLYNLFLDHIIVVWTADYDPLLKDVSDVVTC